MHRTNNVKCIEHALKLHCPALLHSCVADILRQPKFIVVK